MNPEHADHVRDSVLAAAAGGASISDIQTRLGLPRDRVEQILSNGPPPLRWPPTAPIEPDRRWPPSPLIAAMVLLAVYAVVASLLMPEVHQRGGTFGRFGPVLMGAALIIGMCLRRRLARAMTVIATVVGVLVNPFIGRPLAGILAATVLVLLLAPQQSRAWFRPKGM